MAPLSACICRRGRASATACRPSTSIADAHRSLRPGDDAERRQHLGQVGVEQRVVDGELGEAEVDHPRGTVTGHEHVGPAEVTVGDAAVPEEGDLAEHRPHQVVRDRVGIHPVEGRAIEGVVREQHRVEADAHDPAHARGPDADITGDERDERLVFDRAAQ